MRITATNLLKYQWDYIHDPENIVGIFEEDGEGESVNKRKAYEQIEALRYGRATRNSIDMIGYSFSGEDFIYPQGITDGIVFWGIVANPGNYVMSDKFCAGNYLISNKEGDLCNKYVFNHNGGNCANSDFLGNTQVGYPGELTCIVRSTSSTDFISKIINLSYKTWLDEFKQLIKDMDWERLQYYPDEAYLELSIDDKIDVIKGITANSSITDGHFWTTDKEKILANVVQNIETKENQKKLLEILLESNRIINLIKDIDGSELKTFVFIISDYISKVYGKESYYELTQYTRTQYGQYNKIFRWAETSGPDPSYHSVGSRRLGNFSITYDTDWWFDEEEKLMDLEPYEFVGIQVESAIPRLSASVGDFVVIPAVLFHWLLKQNDRDQAWDDAILTADIALTVFTFGTYAGVKIAVKIGTTVTTAMAVDFVCQSAILSLGPDFDMNSIRYNDIAWSGASSIITNSNYSFIISPIRTTIIETYLKKPETIETALLIASENLANEFLVAFITKGTVGLTKYRVLLENTFEKAPRQVYNKLISMNITPEAIQSVSEKFVSSALKQKIKGFIDESK